MSGASEPVLQLTGARAQDEAWRCDLELWPGELVLIQANDPDQIRGFTDLCCGLLPARDGQVRVLGRDLAALAPEDLRSLRGRIGIVSLEGGWAPHLSVAESILMPALFHRLAPYADLRERAAELCRRFGLPGLPLERPERLTASDLARAACARAFLGRPALLLLESPLRGDSVPDLRPPLLDALANARETACLWLTMSLGVWSDRAMPAQRRYRLGASGLQRVQRIAA
jgi:phospholipid/cholesterol/gamma-HCH transport system ATP-binding protein